MPLKVIILFIYLFLFHLSFSQTENDSGFLNIDDSNVKLNKENKGNAVLLIEKISNGKSNEKEKFDAIFSWVARNINYNINYFYTPSASSPKKIEQILKTKKTICLGYAQLMDTLCQLANIANVSVFGYAKDKYYDVGDSIFGHNHAWNAVRLDGEWYVYDVTWSSGVLGIKETKSAKWILKLLKRFPEKYKKKVIRVSRKFRNRNFCNEKISKAYYYKQRFLNRLIRNWLMRLPIKVSEHYYKGLTTDYYLSNPEKFAATHVPDDPLWSLLDRKKCAEFEQDSLFYYLTDSTLKKQNKNGKICPECDAYYEKNFQGKLVTLNHNSSEFNYNNKFITTYCNEELGKILFLKSLNTSDNRIRFADSAVSYYQSSLNDIIISRKNMDKFVKYEKSKNNRKAKLLLKDNVYHTNFIKSKVKQTLSDKKYFLELANKSGAFVNVYNKNIEKFSRFKTENNFDKLKPYSDKKIEELEKNQNIQFKVLDSLDALIDNQKNQYDSILTHLALNIWPQVLMHDSILKPFEKCIAKRRILSDGYKKGIVDIRKRLYPMEYKYTKEIDAIIYSPASQCIDLFNTVTKTIKYKQTISNDLLKTKLELVKTKVLSKDELKDFKQKAINEAEKDLCWLISGYPKLVTSIRGFEFLSYKQNLLLKTISIENASERNRQSTIDKGLNKGYKHSNKDIANYTKLIKKKYKEIIKYKAEISNPLSFSKSRYDKIIDRIFKLLVEEPF